LAAAAAGHPEAICVLGIYIPPLIYTFIATFHYAGYELPKNRTLGVDMWKQSAQKGNPYSIYMLHHEVKDNTYSREDADKAFQELLKRGETGNYRDKWHLGRIYHGGI
jgi:TPR repeat protein